MEYVSKNDKDANIIYVDFNSLGAEPYLEYHALNNYIEKQYDSKKTIMFALMKFKCVMDLKKLLTVFTVV